MAKIKLTKTELKSQKDALKSFRRYLPTLMLKKQQLQLVVMQLEIQIEEKRAVREALYRQIENWIAVFADDSVDLSELVKVSRLNVEKGNIAGVDIPLFKSVEYEDVDYNLFETPVWVDKAIEDFKGMLRYDAELSFLHEEHRLLSHELRLTSQRVNLFEKVKIPEARHNIRRIQIALGDEQTAGIVRGKIAKNKLIAVGEELA